MAMPSERHDVIVGNLAKAATVAVIAIGLALIIAMFVYTV